MKVLAIAAMAATLPLVAVGTASAQTGMMHGVVHAGMKARCSPGDPNVMVNRKNKTFMLDKNTKMSMMKPGTAKSATNQDTGAGTGTTYPVGTNMVSMCKSEAMSMGAKMMGSGMHKNGM